MNSVQRHQEEMLNSVILVLGSKGEQAMQKEIHFAMRVTIKIKLVPYNFRPSLV